MKATFKSLILVLGLAFVSASPVPQTSPPSYPIRGPFPPSPYPPASPPPAAHQEPATPQAVAPPASLAPAGIVDGLSGSTKKTGLLGGTLIPGILRRDNSIPSHTALKRQNTDTDDTGDFPFLNPPVADLPDTALEPETPAEIADNLCTTLSPIYKNVAIVCSERNVDSPQETIDDWICVFAPNLSECLFLSRAS